MIEIYVVFMFFAIHGCDDVLEECFSKYVLGLTCIRITCIRFT